MKKLSGFAAVFAAFSGLLLGSVTAVASPVVRQNFRITITEVGLDPCAGDQPVAVTETLHFVLLVNADNAGGFHVNSVVNIENGGGTHPVTREHYVAPPAHPTP